MAITRFAVPDWLAGWLVNTSKGDAYLQAVVLTDTTGAATGSNTAPVNVTFPKVTWTQTSAALSANTSATLIAANANRKALRWMNVGANPCTVVPGAGPAVANAGMNYSPPSASGYQGGSESFTSNEISTQAFTAISTLGTTVIVWEGV